MTVAGQPRLLFYVQHLLGIGHLKRAATLSRAFGDAGFDVTLVSGGHAVPGLDCGDARFVQLPPVRAADKYFKILVDSDDREIDDDFRAGRRDMLLAVLAGCRPDVLVTELFPFGRRQLRHEILPMLEAARRMARPPLIVSSVRDILVEPAKPERVAEMLDRVRTWYDLVLVHGDPNLIPFDETFPLAHAIADRLRYTGYVVDPPGPRGATPPEAREVLVSAGGGALSETLFDAAMAARPMTRLAERPWRMLAGHALPDANFETLRRRVPAGVTLERARPDFTSLLADCALSISQGGYNTVMEVLAARARGVVVPYAGGLETEQTLRARLIRRSGGIQVVDETALDGHGLARAVEAALEAPRPGPPPFDTDGGPRSAEILLRSLPAGRAA